MKEGRKLRRPTHPTMLLGCEIIQQERRNYHAHKHITEPRPQPLSPAFVTAHPQQELLRLSCHYSSTGLYTRKQLPHTPLQHKMEADSVQELSEGMSRVAAKKWSSQPGGPVKVPESMVASLKRVVKSAQSSNGSAKRLLEFAHTKADGGEKLLKVTSAPVPRGILPEGYEAVLHDIKVSGRQADDSIYSNHPDIRQKIPRGTTVMDLKRGGDGSSSSSNKELIQDVVIYANRKFTGSIGDEDDTQPENNDLWQKYFLKDQEEAQKVVCMKKINGEAAHFSGRFIEGQFYIITGSKNVHMIIREEEDIDKYEGERYTVARVVARCVWQTLQALEKKHREFLWKFLDQTKCTTICELLQPENQHIMILSHLKKPLLTVISFTQTATCEDVSSLVAFPPHHTLDLLSCLGFEVPTHTVIPVEEMQKHREEIRRGEHGFHEEGEVLYFLGRYEETIGLVKTKTMWYIMLRALREKIIYMSRRRHEKSLEDRINSTFRRFEEIQEWLLFSDSYKEGWKKLASSFIKWMEKQMTEGRVMLDEIRPKYPVVWDRFLKETEQTDFVEL